jgi:hypothetical protein
LEVEKRIDLLELPKDLEMRSSIEQRFSWPLLVSNWYRARNSATSLNATAPKSSKSRSGGKTGAGPM